MQNRKTTLIALLAVMITVGALWITNQAVTPREATWDDVMRVLAASEPELRREIGRRVLDQLALQVLARAGEAQSRRQSLEHERALLRTRLRILRQQDAGLALMAGSGDAAREQDLPGVEDRLEENERELAALGVGADALEQELDDLVDVLSNPGREIEFASNRVLLTPMNVLVDGEITEPGREVIEIAQRIMSDVENLRTLRDDYLDREKGNLTIATTHTYARYVLPRVIERGRSAFMMRSAS